jgi:hypothetical protein
MSVWGVKATTRAIRVLALAQSSAPDAPMESPMSSATVQPDSSILLASSEAYSLAPSQLVASIER